MSRDYIGGYVFRKFMVLSINVFCRASNIVFVRHLGKSARGDKSIY